MKNILQNKVKSMFSAQITDKNKNILYNNDIQISSSPSTGEDTGGGDSEDKYKKIIKSNARRLRNNQTNTEKYLWKYLRNRQIEGLKFRRQQIIGKYIVDFINFEKKIIIEADGGQHDINQESDKLRDNYLKNIGYKILRFWDNDILTNIEGVLEVIRNEIVTPHLTSPSRREELKEK